MLLIGDGVFGLILFGIWVFCIIDVITTPEAEMRNLPKIAWIFIVILLADIGALVWLIAGRTWTPGSARAGQGRAQPAFPEYDRPGRAAAQDPHADEVFLRGVRERADEQRRQYADRRRTELEAEQARLHKPPTDRDPDDR